MIKLVDATERSRKFSICAPHHRRCTY